MSAVVFDCVPSEHGPWKQADPPMIVWRDPANAGPALEHLDPVWDRAVLVVEGCSPPIWFAGEPRPSPEHYAEVLELNPGLQGWGEPFGDPEAT